MRTTSIKYNKVVTVLTEENGINTVKTIKNRKNALEFISSLECFKMNLHASNQRTMYKVISKLESLGFDLDIDFNYGLYESECEIYANKELVW